MRHNMLRDTEAKFLNEVGKDVKLEPELIPTSMTFKGSTADGDGAHPDISARGVWLPCEKTFFDIMVTHPNAKYNLSKPLDKVYKEREDQKKRKYNDRIMNVEKSSFTPLVFSTTGGMGSECERLNKRLAVLISDKTKERYSHVVSHIRTKLRFSLLKAIVIAIHGYRGKQQIGARG